jgi:hypothetical protein
MDYVIGQSIHHHRPLLDTLHLIYISYDVVCSWSIKWPERLQHSSESLGKMVPSDLEIRRGIGQWHIHGHRRECLVRYGFPFIKGGGGIEGELIELLWSYLNGISAAARAMSTWHRFEAINDGLNHWNWKKLIGGGKKKLPSNTNSDANLTIFQ